MTGRAYLGEVLNQVWLSELLDKQVNAQKIKLLDFMQAPTSPRKVCNENKRDKKNNAHIKYC